MPLQNRVTPFGEIIATEARGTLLGNRGLITMLNGGSCVRFACSVGSTAASSSKAVSAK